MNTESIVIFTDGASRGNPGPGGCAAIIVFRKNNDGGAQTNAGLTRKDAEKGDNYWVHEIGGREEHTTNNRMELRAAIEAFNWLQGSTLNLQKGRTFRAIVYSDSSYLVNGITKWIHGWQKNGWKTKAKQEVENRALWERLFQYSTIYRTIEWKLIEGHAEIAGNVRCDYIATEFADLPTNSRQAVPKLYSGPLKKYPIKNILCLQSRTLDREKDRTLKRNRSRAKAYSYISAIGGVVQIHKNWEECERRVKGKRGAIYKKAFSPEEEQSLIAEFSKLSH